MSALSTRWDTARTAARGEHAPKVQRVIAAMEKDFPSGDPRTRAFLAEDFVVRWILFGEALCGE